MVYSQTKVIAGGLAHVPIIISVFYFIMTSFNKRALDFTESNKTLKNKSKVVEHPTEDKSAKSNKNTMKEVKTNVSIEEKGKTIKEISITLGEIEKKAKDVNEKVKEKKKKNKKKKMKDMKRD